MGIIMHGGVAYVGIANISDANDVDLSSPADGQFLKYNGEKWVNASISAVYRPAGSKTAAQLLPALLIADNIGNVYNMTDSGETTEYFVEGQGKIINAGDNVVIVNIGTDQNPNYKFDMLSSNIDMSEYYTADATDVLLAGKVDKVTGKGLSTNDYTTAEKEKLAGIEAGAQVNTIDIDDIESTKTVQGNPIAITDASPINAESLVVELQPKQDLHGQSAPYVGGAGKNKLPLTVANLKALNTNGTWTGNTYTADNVTFAVQTDADGNVTGIKVNGGNSSNTSFFLDSGDLSSYGGMVLNGTPNTVEGAFMLAELRSSPWTSYAADYGSGSSISNDIGANAWIFIRVYAGASISNAMFYPMIRLSTETDATFAPYTNICPITGYTEVGVEDVGVNQWDEETAEGWWQNGNFVYYQNSVACKNKIPIRPNIPIYIVKPQSANLYYTFYDKNKVFLQLSGSDNNGRITLTSSGIVTVPENAHYMTFDMGSGYGGIYNHDISFNYPSSDHDYHAYASTSATIQFGQTVYGGRSNFTDGGTDDEIGVVDLGSLTWQYDNTQSHPFFYTLDSSHMIKAVDGLPQPITNCEQYRILDIPTYVDDSVWADVSVDGSMVYHKGGQNYIYIRDDRFTNPTDFKNANSGNYLAYMKATPTQLPTPPTDLKLLKGTNNLSADGVMQIGYQPDNVIGELKGEIQAIDNSWKNILPMTKEGIKLSNALTWTDDVTFKSNNVTGTLLMEGGDITGIHVVSTGSNGEFFHLCPEGLDYSRFGGCILSGCTVGDDTKVFIAVRNWGDYTYYAKNTSGDTIINSIPPGSRINIYVYFPSGGTVDTVLRPMIRKAGTDGSYAVPKPSVELLTDLIAYLSTKV